MGGGQAAQPGPGIGNTGRGHADLVESEPDE
jgi:hypothetical protein